MNERDYAWDTIETAEAFCHLTEYPVLTAVMRNYPALVYEAGHIRTLLRLLCLIAGVEADRVNWDQVTEAVLAWACERGYDVVTEYTVTT